MSYASQNTTPVRMSRTRENNGFKFRPERPPDINQTDIHVFKPVQQDNRYNNHEKPANIPRDIVPAQMPPFLEQNRGSDNHKGGEKDVIHRGHDAGVEQIERLVEVVHLHRNADGHNYDQESVTGPFAELESIFQGKTESFAGHDGQATDS